MTTSELETLGADLLGRAIYIALSSDGAQSPFPGCSACAGSSLDVLLHDWLQSCGRWAGRRPCVFIDDLALRESVAAQVPSAQVESRLGQLVLANLAHELAHTVDARVDESPINPERIRLAKAVEQFHQQRDPLELPPWAGHSASWLRLSIHLFHRCVAMGFDVDIMDLFCGARYSLDPPDVWDFTLLGEPACLASESIWNIGNFQPPASFVDYWRQSVTSWADEHAPLGELCAVGVRQALTLFEENDVSQIRFPCSDVDIEAANTATKKGPRQFSVVAYTGGPIKVAGYEDPIAIDLSGLKFGKSMVANLDHEPSKRVGNVTAADNDGYTLTLSGTASAATPARDEVVNSADAGFTWQASIEASTHRIEKLANKRSCTLNGQTIAGPCNIVRSSTLKGFALVGHGADDNTSVSIGAGELLTAEEFTAANLHLAADEEEEEQATVGLSREDYVELAILREEHDAADGWW